MKSKFKLLLTTFILFLLVFTSFCFATDSDNDIMPVSEETSYSQTDIKNSDLYISNQSEYEIKNIINGNVFATLDTLNIDSTSKGGIIEGNLFATAKNVNIKSDITYSDTEKDDLGNPIITINSSSAISGNVFLTTNKFVLEPGCEIDGDLYICANEVYLEQNSKINGNVFIFANKLNLNAQIGGSLYANVNSFNMQYFGFISKDLNLNSKEVNLNGWIYRNSYITAENIVTQDEFINQKNFNVENANNFTFSGKIIGDATINAKNITFKTKDNDNNLTCKISGKLSYSSNQEIEIPEDVVSNDINYSKYVNTSSKNTISNIWDYILSLITLLICVYVIYLLISKFTLKYLDKISNISGSKLLKCFGIGFGFLILVPIITILLFISNVGSVVGLILLFIYILTLIIAKPIFIISIAKFAKEKLSIKMNVYLYILAISIILSLIALIPYLGFIVSLLVNLTGLGIFIRNLLPTQK